MTTLQNLGPPKNTLTSYLPVSPRGVRYGRVQLVDHHVGDPIHGALFRRAMSQLNLNFTDIPIPETCLWEQFDDEQADLSHV
jgi:hypothetical protein